jgi:hypothetical protein
VKEARERRSQKQSEARSKKVSLTRPVSQTKFVLVDKNRQSVSRDRGGDEKPVVPRLKVIQKNTSIIETDFGAINYQSSYSSVHLDKDVKEALQ